ncbi:MULTISPECIES: sigma factor-like helix-turn-helix DNA-binding protein [unclassified Streptomyces]|uniref:RNA polymerase sigma factor n=1 Tax=unclassified Streptomyces TaxID=2593676 RepID=UPI002B1CB3E3|nr:MULTISPECIES: sigma factor-like helix-turn-helix DNA-binding protein [unclassified Streptomyces]
MPDTSPQSTGPRVAVVTGGTGAIGGAIVRTLAERGPVLRALDGASDITCDPSSAQDAACRSTPRPDRERPSTVPGLTSLPTPHEKETRASSRRTPRDVLPHQEQRIPVADSTDYEMAAPPNSGTLDGPAAAAADPAELFALFHRVTMPFIDRLYAAAVQMTRDRRDAEALIEETYLRAFDSFGSLTWQTDARMWMFRFLAETALDARGERQRPVRSSSPMRRSIGRLPDTERPTLHVPQTAEAQAVGRLSEHAVKVALQRLPRKLAIVVYLADVEDFSRVEIAEILSIPPSTAKSRLHYGRRCLYGLLTDPARQRGLLFHTINGSVEGSVAPRWQALGA